MIVEFKEMIGGAVVWQNDYKLAIDAMAVLPREGDYLTVPPSREERRVRKVVRKYGEHGLRKVVVTLF